MDRRSLPCLLLLTAVGCGGAGQQTSTAMAPTDPSGMRSNGAYGAGGKAADNVFKPSAGANSPLGVLKALSEKSPLAKPADGKATTDGAAKLAKLDKGELKLDDAYGYIVAGADAARTTVGEKGASVPLPAEAKTNPDGSIWVVEAETRRVFTLTGVKREEGKPPVVTAADSGDLVHPTAEAAVPPLALVARADEATTDVKHALRILVKGVGAEGAPEAGDRIRLKKAVVDKDAPPLAKNLIKALKKYGATLAAGDGAPSLPAIADPRWTKEDAKAIASLHMSDFEILPAPVKPVKSAKKAK